MKVATTAGLMRPSTPGLFRGICTAVRPDSYVVTPTGDLHKCWDTVSNPDHRVGSIFTLGEAEVSPAEQTWLSWNPFNESCRSCRLLAACAGGCAHKFVNSAETLGAGSVPCPSWKYAMGPRLLTLALRAGVISLDDVDVAASDIPLEALVVPDVTWESNAVDS